MPVLLWNKCYRSIVSRNLLLLSICIWLFHLHFNNILRNQSACAIIILDFKEQLLFFINSLQYYWYLFMQHVRVYREYISLRLRDNAFFEKIHFNFNIILALILNYVLWYNSFFRLIFSILICLSYLPRESLKYRFFSLRFTTTFLICNFVFPIAHKILRISYIYERFGVSMEMIMKRCSNKSHTASHPRRRHSSQSPSRKPQNLHRINRLGSVAET
jgi:hypothetical protein